MAQLSKSSITCEPQIKFLVIQYGARHNYAIPLAFNRASALAGVYTDMTASQGIGALLNYLPAKPKYVKNILQRRVPPSEIRDRMHAFGEAFMADLFSRSVQKWLGTQIDGYTANTYWREQAMSRRGIGHATHIYTMFGEGGSFVRRAKTKGLEVVGDVYIALSADPIVYQESINFPDWSDGLPSVARIEDQAMRNETLLNFTDKLVCPSEFVRDDLVKNHGVAPDKVTVVHYGVSTRWTTLESSTEVGRILFAGSANLRKGIHYLAMAAASLKGICNIRVAGGASDIVRNHPAASSLTFLGHLGPKQMAEEFSRADVFVLPTLAEGSAGVTAEALGSGIPVVTTKAAGSIVRDRVDGLIVSERDPDLLAEAIRSIVEDRDRRQRMSAVARENAKAATWDNFANGVFDAISRERRP